MAKKKSHLFWELTSGHLKCSTLVSSSSFCASTPSALCCPQLCDCLALSAPSLHWVPLLSPFLPFPHSTPSLQFILPLQLCLSQKSSTSLSCSFGLPPPLLRGEGNKVGALGGCGWAVWPRCDSLFKHGRSAYTLEPSLTSLYIQALFKLPTPRPVRHNHTPMDRWVNSLSVHVRK